jgi:hypothetical protein
MDRPNPGDLIPLEIAVQCIFSAAYDLEPTNERLTGLAQAVVALVPVYVRAPTGEVSLVDESALRDGLVKEGGALIRFSDGRPDLHDLFAPADSVEHARKILAGPEVEPGLSGAAPGHWQSAG